MKKGLTEVIVILDKSGSMEHLTKDTIDGFNSFLKKQQEFSNGEIRLTTVLFNSSVNTLHNSINVKLINPITEKDYKAEGLTALLDAIGITLDSAKSRIKCMDKSERPEHVIVSITTDGDENDSRYYTLDEINKTITKLKEKKGWQFLFIGANIDSFKVASSMGIHHAANYVADSYGTRSLYDTVSDVTKSVAASGSIPDDWDKDLNRTDPNKK